MCLLLHCARIDEKESMERKNSSVMKINPAFDAGRVRISRFIQSHCRRDLVHLGSH